LKELFGRLIYKCPGYRITIFYEKVSNKKVKVWALSHY
jgi:hypothetical protein